MGRNLTQISILWLAFCCGLTLSASSAHAATVTVPSAKFPTIQSAVNHLDVGDGDVIEVKPGTYREAVLVNASRWAGKSLTLRSTAGRSAIIDAASLRDSALTITGGTVLVDGFTLTGGTGRTFLATGSDRFGGGAIVTKGSASPTRVTFQGCAIQGNTARGAGSSGGGAYVSQGALATFRNCDIQGNMAGRLGGGVTVGGGSFAEFVGGSIQKNESGVDSLGGAGGGLFINASNVAVSGTQIVGNTARLAGGGIEVFNPSFAAAQSSLTMRECEVSGNTALAGHIPGQGGGIHVEDNALLDMSRCRVRDNSAATGGGISNFRGQLEITESIVDANVAGAGQGLGGGIASFGNAGGRCAAVILEDTAVHANQAASGGGGIYSAGKSGSCAAKLNIARSLLSANFVEPAPGVQGLGGAVHAFDTALDVRSTHVLQNTVKAAIGYGGGFAINGAASATGMTDITLAGNQSPKFGGGIYLDAGSNGRRIDLSGSRIYDNAAADPHGGGGLFISGTNATGTVADNVIADNDNFQLGEQTLEATKVTYTGNRMQDPERKIYASRDTPPVIISSVPDFNEQLAAVGRGENNVDEPPSFVQFAATPQRFSLAVPDAFLSWSAARATALSVTGVDAPAAPTGVAEVTGPCTEDYSLAGQRADQSTFGPVQLTIPGGDCLPPETTITSGPAHGSTIVTRAPTFTFTSSETGSTFQCKVDASPFVACASPYTTPPLADGVHTFVVRAIDAAGNVDPRPPSRSFAVQAPADTSPPETTITAGPANGSFINAASPSFEFISNEPGSFQCRVDAAALVLCDSPFTTPALAEGAHTFTVRATDAAGNSDPTPAIRSFTVDRTAPRTSITGGPSGRTRGRAPTFRFRLSSFEPGAVTFACKMDKQAFSACSSPPQRYRKKLSFGKHVFRVRATDAAGNIGPVAVQRFKIIRR